MPLAGRGTGVPAGQRHGQHPGKVLAYGVVTGLVAGLVYCVPLAVVASWFPERKGLAVGLAFAPATILRCFLAEHYAEIYGLVFIAYGVGALVGALITGQLRDWLGTYSATFLPLTVLDWLEIVLAATLLPGAGDPSRSRDLKKDLDLREQGASWSGQDVRKH